MSIITYFCFLVFLLVDTVAGQDCFCTTCCDGCPEVTIPTTATEIASFAFQDCTTIQTVIIPTSTTFLGKYAFYATALTGLILPTSMVRVSDNCFAQCSSLRSLTIPTPSLTVCTLADAALRSLDLPTSLVVISDYAFSNNIRLATSLMVPTSVTYLGQEAFISAVITKLSLPTSVRVIADFAFFSCKKLGIVNLPTSVASIGAYAFNSDPISEVIIPTSVVTLAPTAFPTSTTIIFAAPQPPTIATAQPSRPSYAPSHYPTYKSGYSTSGTPSYTRPQFPTIVSTITPTFYPTLTPTYSAGTLQVFHATQTILGLTASEFSSNANNTEVLTAAIVSCFKAPISITASQVLNLVVVAAAGERTQLLSTSSSSPSILVSYDIFTSSKYPSSAYSTQLSIAVGSGAFTRSLQMHAALRGTTCLLNATSSMVSVGDRNPSLLPTVAVGPSSTGSQGDGFLSVGLLAGIAAGSLAVCILCGVALMRCQSVRRCCWSCCGWCSSGNSSSDASRRPSSPSRGKSSYMQFPSYDSRIESSAVFDDAII
eukprot:gene28267-37186_t